MNDALTPGGRGHDIQHDAEPFFPSEGMFKSVVPLAEVDDALLPTVGANDVNQSAGAALSREAHSAPTDEEATFVRARVGKAQAARPSRMVTTAAVVLSVMVGVAIGMYLNQSSQRAPEARVEAVSPPLPPAAVAEATPGPDAAEGEAAAQVEKPSGNDGKAGEVAKAEKSNEPARAPKQAMPPRSARAAAVPVEVTPAPVSARAQPDVTAARTRTTNAPKQTPATSARSLPISSPPPSAQPKRVIQWP